MDEKENHLTFRKSTREAPEKKLRELIGLLIKEAENHGSITDRIRDDTDDGYYYIELDLEWNLEGDEFDLSVNGRQALIRFVRKVRL